MFKSFKYRLYPNKAQAEKLLWTLERCCELYNAALQERKEAWTYAKKRITHNQQSAQLPEIKQIREEYRDIYSQILKDVLWRLDRAFQAFFRRCREGEKPGFPRYQGRRRYTSFTYPQMESSNGYAIIRVEAGKILLPKIGSIKIKLHRSIEGTMKTCTIKREGNEWYAVFACEVDAQVLLTSYEDVGIDLGVSKLATLSNGEVIEHPRCHRKAEKKIKRLHQAVDRKRHGSNRRKKAIKTVAKAHRKIANQRRDYLHKESRKLVSRYQVIVFEDLPAANLIKRPKPKQDAETGQYLPNGASKKAGLNKSISDAGWYEFVAMCAHKAECAGRTLLQVNPRYTSQICSGCGQVRKKELSERWHSCECGTELDRDHNAAINILRAGRVQQSAMAVKASA